MSRLKRVLVGGSIYFATNLLIKGITFLLLPVYTRHLSPQDYGIFSLAIGFIQIVVGITGVGLLPAATRIYFRYHQELAQARLYLATNFITIVSIAGLTSLAMTLAVMAGVDSLSNIVFNQSGLTAYLLIAIWVPPFNQITEFVLVLLQNQEKPISYGVLNLIRSIGAILLTILFVVGLGQGATGSLTAQLIAAIIAALVAFNYFRRDFSLQFSRRHLLESLQFGLPLMPHILSGWLTSYIDRIALSRYKALADVGIYSVGLSISTIMLFWVASLIQAWNPFFFKTLEAEGTAAHPKLVQATTLMVLIFLLPAFTLAAFAKEIVFVMAAPSFHAAYAIVPVLTLYYFIGGLNNLVVAKLYFVNATAWVSLSTFISLAVAVGANILLVPQYGMPGAAIASVASSLVVTGLNWAKSQRLYPMQYEYWQITKAMGLSLALFAFSFLIPNLGLALTIGIKLFGTVLLGMGFIFLGALNKSEIELIKLVIRKALTRVPPFKAEDTL